MFLVNTHGDRGGESPQGKKRLERMEEAKQLRSIVPTVPRRAR